MNKMMTFDEYLDIFLEEAERAENQGLTDDEAIDAMDARYAALGLSPELENKYSAMMLSSNPLPKQNEPT